MEVWGGRAQGQSVVVACRRRCYPHLMLSSPSPTRPHGHAVRRTTLARRRHLAAAAAAGAAVATLALLAAGRAPCAGPGAPWTAAWAAVDDAPAASNRLADAALAGDGAGVEAGGSTAPPPHPAGTID